MGSTGLGSRLLAALSTHVLRVVGLLTMTLSIAVAAATVSTEYSLGGGDSGTQTTAYAADAGILTVLVDFSLAHPAYPVAVLVGLVLFVAGDETPLIGS